MANRSARTYDDIVRRTVPEPDSSFRPSREQERRAFERVRTMDADEEALYDRVRDVLQDKDLDCEGVSIEVRRDHVFVRGQVPDEDHLQRIPELIRTVEGVGRVEDHLVVVPPGSAD